MNKLMIVVIALFFSTTAFSADGFDKMYAKYAGNDNITSINLSKSLITIASKFLDENDADVKVLLESIEGVKLMASDKGNHGDLSAEAKQMMRATKYEDLIKINDDGQYVSVMVDEAADETIREILIFVDSENEFALISVKGNIDPTQVGKVLQTLDIDVDGLDVLTEQ